jgi:hypothetical protein
MTTQMKGLPIAVLHDLNRDQATMRVRLAGLTPLQAVGQYPCRARLRTSFASEVRQRLP